VAVESFGRVVSSRVSTVRFTRTSGQIRRFKRIAKASSCFASSAGFGPPILESPNCRPPDITPSIKS